MSPPAAPTRLHCEHAFVDGRIQHDVLIAIADGVVTAVSPADGADDRAGPAPPPHGARTPPRPGVPAAAHLRGVVVPGLVNAHSHVFHRALRGRTHGGHGQPPGSFWSWRDRMYAVAARLDPDTMHALARAVFAEMALAGITCVGEFHYLHHQPDGTPYANPNTMGSAIVAAAADVGVRLTLLDTAYLTGEVGATLDDPRLDPVQRRFSDGDHDTWARRVADLDDGDTCRIGAAIHSVRAVPPASMAAVAAFAGGGDGVPARVLHAHVSEQPAENEAARGHHGRSPTRLLADAGALSERFTAVHGVWLDEGDVALLADAGARVCACPTTERDLADGIMDAAALRAAGVPLALGSDQHAVIDLFAEARALELHQRLATQRRGLHDPAELLAAATAGGAASLGWPELGRIEVGAPADLAVVSLDSARLAGTRPQDLAAATVFAATADDVTHTMVAGRWIAHDGRHATIDVPGALADAIGAVDRLAQEQP